MSAPENTALGVPRSWLATAVLRNALQGPINVGDQPGGRALGELGATRITFGPRLLQRTMTALEDIVAGLE